MIQEDKELLLKDLSARVPYGVIAKSSIIIDGNNVEGKIASCTPFGEGFISIGFIEIPVTKIKPYLRPMSSMTEEEKNELHNNSEEKWANALDFSLSPVSGGEVNVELESIAEAAEIDWLNAHHFDYRGLIEKGLALEAPEGMYSK